LYLSRDNTFHNTAWPEVLKEARLISDGNYLTKCLKDHSLLNFESIASRE
jgi:hypothetical protein